MSSTPTMDVINNGEARMVEPAGLTRIDGDLLGGVSVAIDVRLGQAMMTVAEMMALKAGAVVALETGLAEHAELYLNGTLVARGEIVAVGDKYGVRIVEIASR